MFYRLKGIINIKTSYLVVLSILSLVLTGLFFSYAIFNIKIEKSGVLNVVTANLYYKVESTDLDANNQIVIQPNSTKEIVVKITNLNSIKTTYNLWYKVSTPANIEVLYDLSKDPVKGDLINEYTNVGNSKTVGISLENKNTTPVTFTIGVRGGIYSKPLSLENTELGIIGTILPKLLADKLVNNLGPNGTVYEPVVGGTKYIRSAAPTTDPSLVNNYVWWSGMMWRIYAINPDGSTKIITDDNVSALSFQNNSNTYTTSYMKEWLETYFYPKLNSSKDTILKQNNDFCIDSTDDIASARTTCTNKLPNLKVGLLTLDEYNIIKNGSNTNYLNNETYYWLMTPYTSGASYEWGTYFEGDNDYYAVADNDGSRPVVVFTQTATISSGNGTLGSPYKMVGDTVPAVSGTKLNLRYTGEFISYDNKLWRIMEVSGGLTKVIYDGVAAMPKGIFGSNNLDWATMKARLDGIGISTAKIAQNQTWQRGIMNHGNNVLTTSLGAENPITSTFGLPKVGEMWTSQNNNKTANYAKFTAQDYWLMTPITSAGEWYAYPKGSCDYDGVNLSYGSRPVFFFTETVTISSGNGTPDSPYILG